MPPTSETIAHVNERIEELRVKEKEIRSTLNEHTISLWKLRELCLTKDGLISDDLRQKAWPILVGLNTDLLLLQHPRNEGIPFASATIKMKKEIRDKIEIVDPSSVKSKGFSHQTMARSLDAEQIDRDIARCTWHLLTGSQRMRSRQMRNKHRKRVADLLKKKQTRLGNLINLTMIHSYQGIFREEDKFRYFQGYHDVASIFLSTLGGIVSPYSSDRSNTSMCHTVAAAMKTAEAMGLYLPAQVLLKVSHSHFRDALRQNFQLLTAALKITIMPMIRTLDAKVFNHLHECEMEPFFALSWILTWFSHDVRDTALVKRLFDVFIASHPLMPIYMAVAMVLHPVNRQDILDTECDFSSLHSALSQLPRKSSNCGWKFIGTCDGGEYVSGDEDEDEASVEKSSIQSWDDSSIGSRNIDDDDGSFAPSLASSSLWSSASPVPVSFEEIIELSLQFMRRIPPRKLISLASNYANDQGIKLPLEEAQAISLFQNPPPWTTANTTPSLTSIKMSSSPSLSVAVRMKKKKKIREDNTKSSAITFNTVSELDPDKWNFNCAIIAAGLGPDGDGEKERARKLRSLSVITGITAIALTSFFWIISIKARSALRTAHTNIYVEDFSGNGENKDFALLNNAFVKKGDPSMYLPQIHGNLKMTGLDANICHANPFLGKSFAIIEYQTYYKDQTEQSMVKISPADNYKVTIPEWMSPIMKFMETLKLPKIDPLKLFQAISNFLMDEISKILKFGRTKKI